MSFVLVRRWMATASGRERTSTVAAVMAAAVLVAVALVPAPAERDRELVRASGAPTAPDRPGVGTAQDAVGPIVDGGVAGGPGAVPGTARPVAGPDGAGAPPGQAGRSPLTATDRGVTADEIRIGFTVVSWSRAHDVGINPGVRDDVSEAIDALVAHANERGGVLGRRIVPVKVRPDLTSAADQRQKCLQLTETEEVFAVVDSVAFSAETSSTCITAEHRTILLSGSPGSSANIQRGAPYLVSVHKDDNRKIKDLAYAAHSNGFFDPARGFRRLGIYSDACAPSIFDSPTDGLKAHLRDVGVTTWTEYRAACSAVTSLHSDAGQAVLRFRDDGVTHVLLAAHPPHVDNYLEAAGGARFYPQYFAGDYFNVVYGALADEYEPVGFDGALGVTQTHQGAGRVGKPLSPLAQECSAIFEAHGLDPVRAEAPDDLADDLEVLELCEGFMLFLEVATAAGPNLTRASWVRALGESGAFRAATVDLARFWAGKQTGGDTTKLVRWHASCRCWKDLTDFSPAVG